MSDNERYHLKKNQDVGKLLSDENTMLENVKKFNRYHRTPKTKLKTFARTRRKLTLRISQKIRKKNFVISKTIELSNKKIYEATVNLANAN